MSQVKRLYDLLDGLPVRSRWAIVGLCQGDEQSADEIAKAMSKISRREFERAPNLGKVSIKAIEKWLREKGYQLRDVCPYCGQTIHKRTP